MKIFCLLQMSKGRLPLYGLIFAGIVLLLVWAFFCYRMDSEKSGMEIRPIPGIPQECLRDGYLICRHGDGIWSNCIIRHNFEDKRFSHIGILSVYNGRVSVIHADTSNRFGVRGRVIQESLETFLMHSRRIGIFRLKRFDAAQLASNARQYVGRPFDWKLNADESEAIYCSELVKLAIQKTEPGVALEHIWKKNGNSRIIPVDAFIRPQYAEELFDWKTREPDSGTMKKATSR